MSIKRNKLQRDRAQIRRVKTDRQERDNRREKVVIYKSAAAFLCVTSTKRTLPIHMTARNHDSSIGYAISVITVDYPVSQSKK